MMDIREGDVLVVGTKEYSIKACSEWTGSRMNSASFQRTATVSVSTKRSLSASDGKRLPVSTYLTGLKATPLDPVSAELATSMFPESTPHELLQTFVADTTGFINLILEDKKR
jgi:hypothetical protein